jgi:hypothetical protein
MSTPRARALPTMLLRGAVLLAAAGVAGAQSQFNVTMRVVDDARGLDTVLIVIGADAVETPVDPTRPAGAETASEGAAQ